MFRNAWMHFYIRIQEVSSTCFEMQGCISMYVYLGAVPTSR